MLEETYSNVIASNRMETRNWKFENSDAVVREMESETAIFATLGETNNGI